MGSGQRASEQMNDAIRVEVAVYVEEGIVGDNLKSAPNSRGDKPLAAGKFKNDPESVS